MRSYSGHSWVVQGIKVCKIRLFLVSNWVCKMGSFLVCNWNCFKRVSLIGKFDSVKYTWWIKLSSIKSGLELLKWDLLRASETSTSLPGEYWISKSCFWRLRKNFWIGGGQEIIDLLKIECNGLWSLNTINLWLYKYSWKRSAPKAFRYLHFHNLFKKSP